MIYYESVRGCPYRCSFCNYPYLFADHVFRYKSAERMADDWQRYWETLGVRYITCLDSLFTVPTQRPCAFASCSSSDGFPSSGFATPVRMIWPGGGGRLMKAAGACQVQIGIESGDPQLLLNMNKNCTVKPNAQGAGKLSRHDLTSIVSLIVGFPGETAAVVGKHLSLSQNGPPDFYFLAAFSTRVAGVPLLRPESRARFGLQVVENLHSMAPYWKHQTMSCTEVGNHVRRLDQRLMRDQIALNATLFYTGMLQLSTGATGGSAGVPTSSGNGARLVEAGLWLAEPVGGPSSGAGRGGVFRGSGSGGSAGVRRGIGGGVSTRAGAVDTGGGLMSGVSRVVSLSARRSKTDVPRWKGSFWRRSLLWLANPYAFLDQAQAYLGVDLPSPAACGGRRAGHRRTRVDSRADDAWRLGCGNTDRRLAGSAGFTVADHAAGRAACASPVGDCSPVSGPRGDAARDLDDRANAERDPGVARGRSFRAYDLSQRVALRAILAAFFGVDAAQEGEAEQLVQRFLGSFRSPLMLFIKPLRVDAGPLSPWGRAMRNRRHLCAYLQRQIELHRQTPKATMLGRLLEASAAESPLADEDLIQELLALLLFGHDTGAATMAWAIAHLYSDPRRWRWPSARQGAGTARARIRTSFPG